MEADTSYEDGEMFYPIVDLHVGKKNNGDGEEVLHVIQNAKHSSKSIIKKNKKTKDKKSCHRKMARRKLKLNLKQLSELKHSMKNEDQIDTAVFENGIADDNDAEHIDDDEDEDDNSPLKNFKKKKKRKKKKDKLSKSRLKIKSVIYPDNSLNSEKNENGYIHNFSSGEVTVKTEQDINNGFEFCTLIMKNVEDIKEEAASDGDEFIIKPDYNTYPKSDEESDDDVPLSKLENKNPTIEIEQTKPLLTKRKPHRSSDEDSTWGVKRVKKMKKLKVKKLKLKIKKEEISFDEVHDVKPSCEECNKSFKSIRKYNLHLQKTHQKPYSCSICPKTFHKQSKLEDHFNLHTGERPYSCYLCEEGASFKSEASLKNHVKNIHSGNVSEKKQFPCTLCTKVLSSYTCLEEHIRLHTGEKPIACKLCGKHFTRERDMRQHLNLHKEMWKCDQCSRCFLTPFKLKEHYRSHTGETPYECDKCERKFARVADFRYHVGTHLGLKPYGCELCGMRFTTSSSVTRHRLNMHQSGPKHHQCHICEKKFHTESRLKTHIKNHENSKRFRCDLCPAARGSLAELNKHALIHGGEFRCDTCHKGCSTAERLANHVARHDLAGKPYACFVCSLGYRSSQSLNKHLATVHKNEDIPKITPQHLCTLCGQVFEHKDKLNRHLKDNHVVLVVGEIQTIDELLEPDPHLADCKPVIQEDEPEHENSTLPEMEVKPAPVEIEKIDYEIAIERDVKLRIDNPIKIPSVTAAVIVEPPVLVVPEVEQIVQKDKPVAVDSVKVKKDILDSPVRAEDFVEDKTNIIDEVKEKSFDEELQSDNNSARRSKKSQLNSVASANEKLTATVHNDESLAIEKDIPVSVVEVKSLSSVRSVKSINASSIPIDVPVVPNTISENNFRVRDLSATSQLNLDIKPQKIHTSRADFESSYMRIPYSEPVIQQNRIVPPSYRSVEDKIRQNFDNYPVMSNTSEHLTNPWFLAAKSNRIQRQMMPRNLTETSRQHHSDLRMPRLDAEQSEQFRNFNHRLADTNQRQSGGIHVDRKYYYDSDLHLNSDRKNLYTDAALLHQRQMNLEDVSRRKFPHIPPSQPMIQEPSARDYQAQQSALAGRDYANHSPSLSVRDLSSALNATSTDSHYNHHSFAAMAASPHNFFRDFRDLQNRMLGAAGVQDYGVHNHHHASLASRHIAQLSGMDMSNQRLVNPGSPLSPYNQSSPHMSLDNLSPMSRNSYEDMSGGQQLQQIANSSNPAYQPSQQVGNAARNVPTQGIESNNKDSSSEQMGGSVPYEMRVAAN